MEHLQSAISSLEAERAELETVLASESFARSNNLARLLAFICRKHFEGTTGGIKEYSIAVQALGRPDDFDPQTDTIVRVTAHALRKRLEQYYQNEGAGHAVHICLPAGHYIPKFIHKNGMDPEEESAPKRVSGNGSRISVSEPEPEAGQEAWLASRFAETQVEEIIRAPQAPRRSQGKLAGVAVAVAVIAVAATSWFWLRPVDKQYQTTPQPAAQPVVTTDHEIHALVGEGRQVFTDRSGQQWQNDQFCSGGKSFSAGNRTILGTGDSQLFSAGRTGIFQCRYPVPSGVYEVHLLFAETSGLQENSRNVTFSINDGPASNLDVADDAAGNDIATTRVYADVKPESDGTIHIDFTSDHSFVNAIEIRPGIAHQMLPVRIAAGNAPFRDSQGNLWLADRYFFGGRLSWFGGDLSSLRDGGLYGAHRFGHFHYIVPVVPGKKYTLKLYFLEHWFGAPNGGPGGAQSRVFDVSCNGVMLLKHFDIFREAGPAPLVKTFPHIDPTPQGKLEIYFTPDINYPSISAIEVLQE